MWSVELTPPPNVGETVTVVVATLVPSDFEGVAALDDTNVTCDDTVSEGVELGKANNSELATTSKAAATENQMRKETCMLILLSRGSRPKMV